MVVSVISSPATMQNVAGVGGSPSAPGGLTPSRWRGADQVKVS